MVERRGAGRRLARRARVRTSIDQIRTTIGEFESVEREPAERRRPPVDRRGRVPRALPVTRTAAPVCCRASPPIAGPMLFVTRVAGTRGTAWAEGDRVRVADADGTRDVPSPDDLAVAPADPPPSDLLVERVRPAALDRYRRRPVHAARGAVPRLHRGRVRTVRSRARDLRRRRRDDGSARRDPAVGARRQVGGVAAMTGAVVVGTGFGCITHVRALRAAGFEVHALVGRDPGTYRRARGSGRCSARVDVVRRGPCPSRGRCRDDRDATAHPRRARARRARARGSTCCARSRSPATRTRRAHSSPPREVRASCTCWARSSVSIRPGPARRAVHDGAIGDPRLATVRAARARARRRERGAARVVGRRRPGRRLAGRARLSGDRSDPRDPRRVRSGHRRGRARRAHHDGRRRFRRALPLALGLRRGDGEHRRRPRAVPDRNARRRHPRNCVDRRPRRRGVGRRRGRRAPARDRRRPAHRAAVAATAPRS